MRIECFGCFGFFRCVDGKEIRSDTKRSEVIAGAGGATLIYLHRIMRRYSLMVTDIRTSHFLQRNSMFSSESIMTAERASERERETGIVQR